MLLITLTHLCLVPYKFISAIHLLVFKAQKMKVNQHYSKRQQMYQYVVKYHLCFSFEGFFWSHNLYKLFLISLAIQNN